MITIPHGSYKEWCKSKDTYLYLTITVGKHRFHLVAVVLAFIHMLRQSQAVKNTAIIWRANKEVSIVSSLVSLLPPPLITHLIITVITIATVMEIDLGLGVRR